MAASNPSPSGFSYAQAAKGRASNTPSQTPSSKVTSGTATPATGTFSELAPNTIWADDVEALDGEKSVDSTKLAQEPVKAVAPPKDIAVERTKSESIPHNASSGVSSPDLNATSSTSTTDDSSSAPNGTSSSETTWETKSQNSEPAWIAERKERQTTAHNDETTSTPTNSGSGNGSGKRGKKEPKEPKESALSQPPPKPVVLTEAPPPAVNIWAKRAEEAKTRPAAVPLAPKTSTPLQTVPNGKENSRSKTEPRKKASSVADVPRETESHAESKKASATQSNKRTTDVRKDARQGSRPSTEDVRSESNGTGPTRAAQREAQSMPNLAAAAPPSVKDETSWPTPDSAQEQERKASEKESEETGDADSSAAGKSRDKTKWTPLPVTPTIVWQTEEMNRPRGSGSERGGRGGTAGRGRGGLRGAPNGGKGTERSAGRNTGSPSEGENAIVAPTARSSVVDRDTTNTTQKGSNTAEHREARQSSNDGQSAPKTEETTAPNESTTTASTRPTAKADNPAQDVKPAPVTRQPVHAVPADETRDGADGFRDGMTKKHAKEPRSSEVGFAAKEWTSTRGKASRGGRGRGGSREFMNGHQASTVFANGHVDFNAGPFGVPQSPSAFQTPRGGQAFGYPVPPQGGRGGWRSGGSRSQSIPMDHIYGRSYGSPPQLPPMQAYYPGMYEYPAGGMPMQAIPPFNQVVDPQYLYDSVSHQLEYYFSLDNLLKDMFLRKNMDSQGFVFLDVVASFNRMKQLTTDKDLIKTVCLRSEVIEIRVGEDGKDRLRRREGWEQFMLPMDQREEGAQNEGPQVLHRPEFPQLQYWHGNPIPFRSPPAALSRRSYDAGFAMNGGVTQFAPMGQILDAGYANAPNGEEHRGRSTKSPIRENGFSQDHQSLGGVAQSGEIEPDVFPDDQLSNLTVVVKVGSSRNPPHHTAASRTFSNGSIDTRSIYDETESEKTSEEKPTIINGESATNGDNGETDTSRHASPEKGKGNSDLMLLWVKDKEFPQESLPQNSTLEPYVQLRIKALDQRSQAATGACPYDLDVLYQFWSHFLIRNFNNKMYSEFKYFANSDAQERHSSNGLDCLVQFYAKALASTSVIRDHIVKDYVELVKNEPTILQGAARKQLRQAWRNGALNLKNRKKLTDILDEPFKASLES
jgi:la-related protein 1